MPDLTKYLAERRAAAEAATPGPWFAVRNSAEYWELKLKDHQYAIGIGDTCLSNYLSNNVNAGEVNARHIVLNDPPSVSRMLDVVEAMPDLLAEITDTIDTFVECHTASAQGDISTLDADERGEYDRLCAMRDRAQAALSRLTEDAS